MIDLYYSTSFNITNIVCASIFFIILEFCYIQEKVCVRVAHKVLTSTKKVSFGLIIASKINRVALNIHLQLPFQSYCSNCIMAVVTELSTSLGMYSLCLEDIYCFLWNPTSTGASGSQRVQAAWYLNQWKWFTIDYLVVRYPSFGGFLFQDHLFSTLAFPLVFMFLLFLFVLVLVGVEFVITCYFLTDCL